ncbi:MAG TPA: histidinol-phosphatase HisJ [Candidatus Eremiobacteraeota bacterium]|nr:histidinol-phosphatase HisJ [Candidatus Eremiobacteraeota bacterium]
MFKANYHTHCNFCDGRDEAEEYVKAAIKEKMTELGFSSHSPLPFSTTYAVKIEKFSNYIRRIKTLQDKYRKEIKIYLGLEVDYLPSIKTFQDSLDFRTFLDYTIGSVHYVKQLSSGYPWPVDSDDELFQRGINEIFKGNIQEVVENYYSLVREMVQKETYDIIGHLDLIKKNNAGKKYFSEEENWYKNAIKETLSVIEKKSPLLEVNTSGIRKPAGVIYPSPWILRQCKELNIRLMVNSDAHIPEELTFHFSEVYSLLREIGYAEVYHLTDRGWEGVKI